MCGSLGRQLEHGGVAGDVLDRRQQVVLHPHEQPPLLPGVLQVQRLEVVPQAPLPAPDHRHQAEVPQLLVLVERPVLALEDDGHVELLDDEVDHLPGGGAGGDGDADGGALGQTWGRVVREGRRALGRVVLVDGGQESREILTLIQPFKHDVPSELLIHL